MAVPRATIIALHLFNISTFVVCLSYKKLKYRNTRRSWHYAPILLAPVEGCWPFGPLGALRALLGAYGPQYGSKHWTLNFEKLEIGMTLIAISHYIEAKCDYGYFIIFLRCGSKILHKKFQVILSKNEGVTMIFPIQNKIKIWENHRHTFIFAPNDL